MYVKSSTIVTAVIAVFAILISLNIRSMWLRGEITGVVPRTHREKVRLWWMIAGAVNFAAFVVHITIDHASAFFSESRLVDGVYRVTEHGKDIPFTPARFTFSFWHGLLFTIVQLACMIALWRSSHTQDLKRETRA